MELPRRRASSNADPTAGNEGGSIEDYERTFSKYILQQDWPLMQQQGCIMPPLILAITHPKTKLSFIPALPASTMRQHGNPDGSKKTGGHHASYILEPAMASDEPCQCPYGRKLLRLMEIAGNHGSAADATVNVDRTYTDSVYPVSSIDLLDRLQEPLTECFAIDGHVCNLKYRGDCFHNTNRSNALNAMEIIYLSLTSFIVAASVNFIAQGYAFAAESLLTLSLRRVMLYQLTDTHVCFGSTHLLYLLWAK
jgi:hypothetical protein